jgi:S-adenosylmethionine:tRNA ribosyltransferase-isomerase
MDKLLYTTNYDYYLEDKRIALQPLQERDQSKLLVYRNNLIHDGTFGNLGDQLPEASTLILNNSKVINARVLFQKTTGGKIEIFCLEPDYPVQMQEALGARKKVQWKCLIGGASKWKPGEILKKEITVNEISFEVIAKYISKASDFFIIEFSWANELSFEFVLQAAGNVPLPPYIKRATNEQDLERYQTIFASEAGSVAAPTASLHFSEKTFENLAKRNISIEYLTLHAGAGTFKPIQTETIQEHSMHSETFSIAAGVLEKVIDSKNLTAVGTTCLRTLESIYWMGVKLINGKKDPFTLLQWEAYNMEVNGISYTQSLKSILHYLNKNNLEKIWGRTSLIVIPGYIFKSALCLITNFHQPKSTLLLLIAAFVGDDWKKIYEHALSNNYRFLSYGDSSLLWRNSNDVLF